MGQNRTCQVCGNHYSYCPNCGNNSISEPWRLIYDKKECRDIVNIFQRFNGNSFSASEALIKINDIGIPNNLTQYAKNSIDYIKSKATEELNTKKDFIESTSEPIEVKSSPVTEKPKSEEVSTEVPEEPKSEEISAEQPSIIKGFRKRRLERQKKNEEI